MHLIHVFLPLYDNDAQALPKSVFNEVRADFVENRLRQCLRVVVIQRQKNMDQMHGGVPGKQH